MPADAELEVAKAALAVARDAVANQQAHIRELRLSAAGLLTGTALAASFLGGRALDARGYTWLAFVGLAIVAASLGYIFTVLIPGLYRGDVIKEVAEGAALLGLAPVPADRPRDVYAHEQLTYLYDKTYELNVDPAKRMARRLAIAAFLVFAEVAVWGLTIGLADRAGPVAARAPCTPATIHGVGGCLTLGQRCDRRYVRQYERYGFICTRRAGDGHARLR